MESGLTFFDRAGDLPVIDGEGVERPLRAVLAPLPALVVFLRHFGCVGCERQLTELRPRQPELSDLGIRIVLVGNGGVEHLRVFAERHALAERNISIVSDPGLATFRAAGLVRSLWATFGPAALISEARAIAAGDRPYRRRGDRAQQGGAVLLDREGRVVLRHVNQHIGDHIDVSDVIDAAMRLYVARAPAIAERGIV